MAAQRTARGGLVPDEIKAWTVAAATALSRIEILLAIDPTPPEGLLPSA